MAGYNRSIARAYSAHKAKNPAHVTTASMSASTILNPLQRLQQATIHTGRTYYAPRGVKDESKSGSWA